MKKARKKRIARRKRRISEREIMRIKRKLKKSARKLRLGAKRTGAYVYGTLRRIVGNPGYGWAKNDIKLLGTSLKIEKGERVRYVEATNIPGGGVFIRPYYPKGIWKMQSEDASIHLSPKEFSEEISMSEPRGEYRPTPQVAPAWRHGIYTGRGVARNPGKLSGVNKTLGWLNAATYPPERKLLLHLAKKDGWRDVEIKRKSKRPFDISIEGVMGDGMRFRADLKLYAIRALTDWPSPEIAMMSDYPQMVMEGDWSGIRDSSDMAIARIFYWAIIKGHGLAK